MQERSILIDKAKERNNQYEVLQDSDKINFLFTEVGRQTAKYVKQAYNKRFNTINIKS
jgi:hypothetical protein